MLAHQSQRKPTELLTCQGRLSRMRDYQAAAADTSWMETFASASLTLWLQAHVRIRRAECHLVARYSSRSAAHGNSLLSNWKLITRRCGGNGRSDSFQSTVVSYQWSLKTENRKLGTENCRISRYRHIASNECPVRKLSWAAPPEGYPPNERPSARLMRTCACNHNVSDADANVSIHDVSAAAAW
jgi:hypothetical protein